MTDVSVPFSAEQISWRSTVGDKNIAPALVAPQTISYVTGGTGTVVGVEGLAKRVGSKAYSITEVCVERTFQAVLSVPLSAEKISRWAVVRCISNTDAVPSTKSVALVAGKAVSIVIFEGLAKRVGCGANSVAEEGII